MSRSRWVTGPDAGMVVPMVLVSAGLGTARVARLWVRFEVI